jgi:hypothetical protein
LKSSRYSKELGFSEFSDMWSFGCVMAELFNQKKQLFETPESGYKGVCSSLLGEYSQCEIGKEKVELHQDGQKLVLKLLELNPSSRVAASVILYIRVIITFRNVSKIFILQNQLVLNLVVIPFTG